MALVTVAGTYGQPAGVGSIGRSDPALDKLIPSGAKIEKVLGDLRFTEGPVWVKSGGVAGVPRLPCVQFGRRKLVRKVTLAQWIEQVESNR